MSVSAAWADFDRDGDLDLYVGNYIAVSSFPYHTGTQNMCYINVGTAQNPQFQEQGIALGVANVGVFGSDAPSAGQATAGCTLSVCTLDFDEDGDQDLMVGNDFGEWVIPDKLYRNDTPMGGALVFTDVSVSTGFGSHGHYNMGINGSDYDLDGDWDFYLSNLGPNFLFQNNGGVFSDVATAAGPVEGQNAAGTLLLTSWGTIWSDFNNDLYEDLLVVNGFIPAAAIIANEWLAPNHVYENLKNGTFQRVDPVGSGIADDGLGRGVGASDVNGDGWMDFYLANNGVVPSRGDSCRLFINQGITQNPNRIACQLRLFGWKSNKEGLGARILAEVDGKTLRRQVLADPVYLSSGTRKVHIGTGTTVIIPKVTTYWPSGLHQELYGVPSGRSWDLLEPRVTLEDLSPSYASGTEKLSFPVKLTNHTSNLQSVLVHMYFYLGENGPLCLVLSDTVSLAPNHQGNFQIDLDVPIAAHNAIKGLGLVQRTYIEADSAFDSRSQAFNIP